MLALMLCTPERISDLVERRQSKPSVDAERSVGDDGDDDGERKGLK